MENCIFCKILKKEIPAHFIYEGNNVSAFLDINPLNKGHVLVIPNEHYADVFNIKTEILQELIGKSQEIAKKMKEVLGADGVNLFNASGEAAEQSVPHFHLHIVPRWSGDGVNMNDWWQSKTKKISDEELQDLAIKLKI
jgi:histidine triad (HIT) family protein